MRRSFQDRIGAARLWIAAKLLFSLGVGLVLLQSATGIIPASMVAAFVPSEPARTTVQAAVLPIAAQAPAPQVARATLSNIRVRRELQIDQWLRPGEFAWNDDDAPAGQTVIVVNIRARVLSVYRAGVEIGRSSLIYGADDKPTPIGTFPILEKDADHVSNLYNAPMPHMLRLTWDGVAIHGSPELRDDIGTHGCIGLPREFAELLFGAVRTGDQVVIWDGVTPA